MAFLSISYDIYDEPCFQRALFALTVALTVALTEGVLFFIWQSRAESTRRKGTHLRFDDKKTKKTLEATETEITPEPVKREKKDTKLRKRRAGQ